MVAYLSKSDASAGFDQIVHFLNAHTIQYALVVNPTIYVSCIKQFWVTAIVKKVNDVVQLRALIDGKKVVVSEDIIRSDLHLDDANRVKCLPNEDIFTKLARMGYEKPPPKLTFYKAFFSAQWKNVDSPSKFLMYPHFLQVEMNNRVDDMTSHNTRYTSPTLTQKVFANMRRVGKGFSGVETPLFASMMVQERHLNNIRKYQNLKKKPVSVAQASNNMIIYLKNIAGYKIEHFREMTYEKVRPIFEREYKKVQTLYKPDKDVEEPNKKKLADETLLQESFKKLRAAKVSGSESTQEIQSNDLKEMAEEDVQNMLEIVSAEDMVALWNLVKEKFSSAVPSEDTEKALWVELKRLFEPDADDVLWKLQRYMHALLTWKFYTDC
nr:xylulose kinase-1 [Tanacetum cinerariifolium]